MEELEEKKKRENEIFLEEEKKKREEMLEKLKQIRVQELDSVKAFNVKLRYFEVQKVIIIPKYKNAKKKKFYILIILF